MPSLREVAKEVTMNSAKTLCSDVSYIPQESLVWRPMEHGKSAVMILSEIAKSNFAIAAAIKGETAKAIETEDFEELKNHVIESATAVCEAIDSLSDEALKGDLTMPWGGIFAAGQAILLPASHMNYHDGQINYIQLLLGDTKFHWIGE